MFLTHWFRGVGRRFLNKNRKPGRTAETARFQPRFEPLEDRSVPAVHIFARGEVLFIEGDRASNVVDLVREENEVHVTADNARAQTFTGMTSVVANLHGGNNR
jgi:hypothetical protein